MAEVWQLEFIDSTSQQDEKIPSGIEDIIGSGANDKDSKRNSQSKKTFAGAFTKKIEDDTIKNVLISPLNTITGGLARPIYRTGKSIMSGAAIGGALGGLGATLGIMAIQKGLEHLQNKIQELDTKVNELNNNDNVLIRAGAVSTATYYSRNGLGIKSTTNRS